MNRVRCAIYTRKSSDEGLDQAFNSLDAQREACEAYIRSQKHEGWSVLSARYDDGGASGGNLDRDALQRLMTDVEAGKVDMIVVYKIDRLTRSLADFAKLVDRLDQAQASFVSVTQQFNTSTSMGRLTLNVLLSFAQFEREVTAERIRDKIAASKKKGMWMGGLVPLGYDKTDTGLVINDREAGVVQKLFTTYLTVRCVRKLKSYADTHHLRSKSRQNKDGEWIEGRLFSRGQLYHLLSNPIYVGRIRHKEITYDGLHEAIVDEETWHKVQAQMTDNAVRRKSRINATNPSPLAGKVYASDGMPLTPSHTSKSGKRYRYYVSTSSNGDWRIPAVELEQAVRTALKNDRNFQLERQVQSTESDELDHVERVEVGEGMLAIRLASSPALLSHPIQVKYTRRRRGVENRIVLNTQTKREPDRVLINRTLKAMDWIDRLKQGESVSEIASAENVTRGYITHNIRLGLLSPKILNALVDGSQRPDVSAYQLSKIAIPSNWADQDPLFFA